MYSKCNKFSKFRKIQYKYKYCPLFHNPHKGSIYFLADSFRFSFPIHIGVSFRNAELGFAFSFVSWLLNKSNNIMPGIIAISLEWEEGILMEEGTWPDIFLEKFQWYAWMLNYSEKELKE